MKFPRVCRKASYQERLEVQQACLSGENVSLSTGQRIKSVLYPLFCWLLIHGAALAAPPQPNQGAAGSATTGSGAYVMSYLLIVLSITLGMLFVCRSSNRRDRARPEVYGKSKTSQYDEEQQEK